MGSSLIQNLTDTDFDTEVLQSPKTILVDYWAEWCAPCKMIAPVLEEIAPLYEGRLQIMKMDVDQNQKTPQKFGIRGIPTLMIFKAGTLAATKVGALDKTQLTDFIDQHLV